MNSTPRSKIQVAGIWVWLFPLSQLLHVAEERWEGYGFHRWLSDLTHTPFSMRHVLAMHVWFIFVMAIAAMLATRVPAWSWVVPGLAILVLLNALAHVVGGFLSPSASSGLVSSVILWVPLGVAGLICEGRRLDRLQFWSGVVAGALTQVPVSWVALRSGRW